MPSPGILRFTLAVSAVKAGCSSKRELDRRAPWRAPFLHQQAQVPQDTIRFSAGRMRLILLNTMFGAAFMFTELRWIRERRRGDGVLLLLIIAILRGNGAGTV